MRFWRWAVLTALLLCINLTSSSAADTDLISENVQQGRAMQALFHIDVLASQSGWTYNLHHQAGDLWLLVGDLTRAISHWQLADLDDRVVARQLADGYLRTQQWTLASQTLQTLLQLMPDDRWAHYQLGLIRAAFDPTTAQDHLNIAVHVPEYGEVSAELLRVLEGDTVDSAMQVGLALAGAEMWPYAELAFQHAADIANPYAEALAYTGITRDWQGKDGREPIELAVQLEPQNPVVRYLEGIHLRFDGDYAGSREALIQAVALDPLNPAFYAELGAAYWLVDDLKSAERWLKMAVEISDDPRFAQALERFYAESGVEQP
jgi:tetratricopeptide (TPR) repeat protein